MNEFIGSFWWLIVTIGVLVTFHEFGHYIVARWCGVKVLRFSIGFGRSLWSRTDKNGTEFCLALIPLGGYVKMLDERDNTVSPAGRPFAFNQKSVAKRIAIIAAGPMANLILCIVLYWAMFVVGRPDFVPVMGKVTGIAAQAGIQDGDVLVGVDQVDTPTQTQAIPPLMLAAIDRRDIEIVLESPTGVRRTAILALSQLPPNFDQTKVFQTIGISVPRTAPPAIVGELLPDGAAIGRLQVDDRILKVGSMPVADYSQLSPAIVKQAKAGQALSIQFERDGQIRQIMLQPKLSVPNIGAMDRVKAFFGLKTAQTEPVWQIGVGVKPVLARKTLLIYGPVEAVGKAFGQTWEITQTTFAMLKRLISGQASVKNVSGTITIAQFANQEASTSVGSFLGFLAFFSLSLCIMNLLPIPVLDGGHLLYCLIELVTGRPVAEGIQIAGQYIGLSALAGLMLLATYNDFARLFLN